MRLEDTDMAEIKSTIVWHSVDESLPDLSGLMKGEGEYVLVRYKYTGFLHDFDNAYITIAGYFEGGFDEYDSFGGIDPKLITHWAYLPNANDGFEEGEDG